MQSGVPPRPLRRFPFVAALLGAGLVASSAATAGDDWVPWAPWGAVEVAPGSSRIVGADLWAPLRQEPKGLLFGDLRGRADSDANYSGAAGLGYRRRVGEGLVGAYAYFDFLRSEYHNNFYQGSVGAEYLRESWEVRLNGYVPNGSEKDTGWNPSVRMVRKPSGAYSLVGTVEQEKALYGADFEAGWLTPLFRSRENMELRVFAGGFIRDATDYDTLYGPTARVELRLFDLPHLPAGSRFVFGGQFRYDSERGTWGTALFRLRIPLNFFGSKEAKRKGMDRRMLDRPVRAGIVTETARFDVAPTTPTGVPVGCLAFADGDTEGDALTVPTAGEIETAIAVAGTNGIIVALDQTGPIDPVNGNQTIALLPGQTVMGGGSSIPLNLGGGLSAVFTAPGGPGVFQTVDEITHFQLADRNWVQSVDIDGGEIGVHVLGDDVGVWDVDVLGITSTTANAATGLTSAFLWAGDRGRLQQTRIGNVSSTAARLGTTAVRWFGDDGAIQDVSIGDVMSVDEFQTAFVDWTGARGVAENVTTGNLDADVVSTAFGLVWAGAGGRIQDFYMGDVSVASDGGVRGIFVSGDGTTLARGSIGNLTGLGTGTSGHWTIGLDWGFAGVGSITDVNIGNVNGDDNTRGIWWRSGSGTLANVNVGNVISQESLAFGLTREDSTGGTIDNVNLLDVMAAVTSGPGSAFGFNTSFADDLILRNSSVGNVSTMDGPAAGVSLFQGSNLSVEGITVGNVTGLNATLGSFNVDGLATRFVSNATIDDVTIGDVAASGLISNAFDGAHGIDLFGGGNLDLSNITLGNVGHVGNAGDLIRARGISFRSAGMNSAIRDVTIGAVTAVANGGSGARAIGVDFLEDGLTVERVDVSTVVGDGVGEGIGIRFLNTSFGTANDLHFGTLGTDSIGLLFDGADTSNNSGSGNLLNVLPLGYTRCVDNATTNNNTNVEMDGLPSPPCP